MTFMVELIKSVEADIASITETGCLLPGVPDGEKSTKEKSMYLSGSPNEISIFSR